MGHKGECTRRDTFVKKPIHPLWGIVEISAFAGIYFSVVYFRGLQIAKSPGLIMAVWVLIIAKAIYRRNGLDGLRVICTPGCISASQYKGYGRMPIFLATIK